MRGDPATIRLIDLADRDLATIAYAITHAKSALDLTLEGDYHTCRNNSGGCTVCTSEEALRQIEKATDILQRIGIDKLDLL